MFISTGLKTWTKKQDGGDFHDHFEYNSYWKSSNSNHDHTSVWTDHMVYSLRFGSSSYYNRQCTDYCSFHREKDHTHAR